MVLGWALQLGTGKGHGVPWFDFKKQSALNVLGQEGQCKNKELKNRFSRKYKKGPAVYYKSRTGGWPHHKCWGPLASCRAHRPILLLEGSPDVPGPGDNKKPALVHLTS